MSWAELLMIAVGLSMDAFAVALGKGLNMVRINYRHALVIAAFFGGFQAGMPLLGWLLGRQFERYITSIDHWVAFLLLAFIGGKMLWDAFRDEDDAWADFEDHLEIRELILLAVATSIDALAVGITFAFLQVSILPSITLIGVTTFILSFIGVALGNRFGTRFESRAEFAGGLVLIFIGTKILLQHLGMI
ncbi:MAG: manganese efflux pump MntP family protein [Syntrophomonadaceae bacterium]